jgi:hypothetical protein
VARKSTAGATRQANTRDQPGAATPPTSGEATKPHEPAAEPSAQPGRFRDLGAIAVVAAKAATIAFGLEALVHADAARFRGKAMGPRVIGYLGALAIVPLVWRLLPNRGPYPRALDFAVTVPLLLDAAGNGLGIYEAAHVDDVVHFANAAIVSGIAGALFAPRVDERWQAAAAGAGFAIVGETLWEIMEYGAWKFGHADGLNLTYEDTMDDIAESTLGAIVGGLFTLTRIERSREDRERAGWREPLGA